MDRDIRSNLFGAPGARLARISVVVRPTAVPGLIDARTRLKQLSLLHVVSTLATNPKAREPVNYRWIHDNSSVYVF